MINKKPLIIILLLFSVINLNSADITINASVDAMRIGIDDVLIYTVKISGDNNPTPPDISKIRDFSVAQSQRGSEFTIINGQSSYHTNFTYFLSPKKLGKLNLPSISYKYDGKIFKSKSYKIEVLKGRVKASNNNQRMSNRRLRSFFDDSFNDPIDSVFKRRKPQKQEIDVFLKTDISKKNVNNGEQILYTIFLYSRNRISNINLISDQSFPGFFQEWKPLPRQIQGTNKEYKGKIYQVFEIRKVALFPTKTGNLTIPSLKFSVDLYDPFAFSFSNSRKIFRTTKEMKINSENFKGLSGLTVGSYTMRLSVPKKKMDINDILTIKLKISGVGNIKTIPIPEFDPNPFFKVFEPVIKRESNFTEQGVTGTITSEMTLNLKKTGVILIPSLNLKVYDPSKNQIINLKTEAVHITVTGIKEKNVTFVPLQKELIKTKSDITYIKEGKITDHRSYYNSKIFYILIFLSFLINIVFILKIFIFDKLIKNNSSLKKRKFFTQIIRSLGALREYENIHSIIEEYFKERSRVGFSDLTNVVIESFLLEHKIPASDISLILKIKGESESAKFSLQSKDVKEMKIDVNKLIKVLKKIENRV